MEKGDLVLIVGKSKTGKTALARKLAQKITLKFIYVSYNTCTHKYLYTLYRKNSYKSTVFIFDNYVKKTENTLVDKIFINNPNFTIIYIMSYLHNYMIDKVDVIYLSREDDNKDNNTIDTYYKHTKTFFSNNYTLDWLSNANDDLSKYGFICLDKYNRCIKEHDYIKIK